MRLDKGKPELGAVQLPVKIFSAQLENGLHQAVAVFHPGLSRLAGRSPVQPLIRSLELFLRETPVEQLWERRICRLAAHQQFELEVALPRTAERLADSLFVSPLVLDVTALVWQMAADGRASLRPETEKSPLILDGAGPVVAYLPQWDLLVVSARPENLAENLKVEMEDFLLRLVSRQAGALNSQQLLDRYGHFNIAPPRTQFQRQDGRPLIVDCLWRQRWRNVRLIEESVTIATKVRPESKEDFDSLMATLTTALCPTSARRSGASKKQPPPARLGRAFGVDQTVQRLGSLLSSDGGACVLLVGPNGCGKTAVFHQLVRQREEFSMGATLFFETTGPRLLFGELSFGAWQERCRALMRELEKRKAVVHFGNLNDLLESGRHSTEPYGVAGFLRPYFNGRQVLAVAEVTSEQRARIEREYPQLLEAFVVLEMSALQGEQLAAILGEIFPQMPQELRATAQELHQRFCSTSAAPGWPVRFLQQWMRRPGPRTRSALLESFSRQFGLPIVFLDDTVPLPQSQVVEWFESRLLGQSAAVRRVTDRLLAFKAGMTRPDRPIASFLLIGPTGTGKTELARCLAQYVFSDRGRITRFDMSEYQDPWSVRNLIGILASQVRDRPFQVVLFDELEKVHPDFLDLLLQILGEARLTDSSGVTADFSNSLVLMTSNLGAEVYNRGPVGLRQSLDEPTAGSTFLEIVRQNLRPELLNRIDEIIPFLALPPEVILSLAQAEVAGLADRPGLRHRQVHLFLGEDVAQLLAEQGYHRLYGARPLKRTVEQKLVGPLGHQLNRYPLDLELRVDIQRQGERLDISVIALNTVEQAQADRIRAKASNRKVSNLRRRLVDLQKGPVVTQFIHETSLRSKRKRSQEGFQYDRPAALLRTLLSQVELLQQQVQELEEEAVLGLDRPAGASGHLSQRAEALGAHLDELILESYSLSLSPDRECDQMVLGFYSEFPRAWQHVATLFLQSLRRRFGSGLRLSLQLLQPFRGEHPAVDSLTPKMEPDFLKQFPVPPVWTRDGWSLTPKILRTELDCDKFLAKPGRFEGLGLLVEARAARVFVPYQQENGLHLVCQSSSEEPVLVQAVNARLKSDVEAFPHAPPAFQLSPELYRRGQIQHPYRCRVYRVEEGGFVDTRMGDVDIGRATYRERFDQLISERLLQEAATAVLRPRQSDKVKAKPQ